MLLMIFFNSGFGIYQYCTYDFFFIMKVFNIMATVIFQSVFLHENIF